MAGNREELVKILRKKYGITNLAELNEAIARLGKIDLSPFVSGGEVINKKAKEIKV